ncbi:hypothetical protein RHMOL_Rhmol01G0140700 [Rhododendron molle]|uniref:Uncharacterized protein n=1 Tax=Rhododendron molle TaxID=49168 RepID=A0ACC0Q2N5_RHOML|nr:hypothetical protein RHMOL_Rhmol01G0140700 [Rhododendron molle]
MMEGEKGKKMRSRAKEWKKKLLMLADHLTVSWIDSLKRGSLLCRVTNKSRKLIFIFSFYTNEDLVPTPASSPWRYLSHFFF